MQIDLFPGFSEQFFHVNGNRLFARVGGPDDAPPPCCSSTVFPNHTWNGIPSLWTWPRRIAWW